MYNTPYYNNQANLDRVNNQIAELERIKMQMQQPMAQPTNLTQNFQLAPNNQSSIKYANSIDDVEKTVVVGEMPFFSNDMSVLWIKNPKGEIKSYELKEIKPLDEKDMQIDYLQQQIEELKGMINNEKHYANDIKSENATDTATNDESVGKSVKTSKSTSVSRVSKSKTK